MAKIDVSRHGIRVILNRCFYNNGTPETPLDVEGTVLFIETHSNYVKGLIKQGDVLEILCTYELELDDTYALVRWDNDVKYWIPSGVLALRNSKLSRCKTIWSNGPTITESTIPFSELSPESSVHEPSLSDWIDCDKYIITGKNKEQKYKYHYHNADGSNVVKVIEMEDIPDKSPESIDSPTYIDLEYQVNDKIIPPLPPSRKYRKGQDIPFSQIEEKLLRVNMSEEKLSRARVKLDSVARTYKTLSQVQEAPRPRANKKPKKKVKKSSVQAWHEYKTSIASF